MLIEGDVTIVVDTGPDFRQQMLINEISSIDSVLYTHYHYDHSGGLDDLRPFSFFSGSAITCHVDADTKMVFHDKYPYVKEKPNRDKNIPLLRFEEYQKDPGGRYRPLQFNKLSIQPLRLVHEPERNVISVGFVFNKKIAYLTDFKSIHKDDEELLNGLDVIYTGAPLMREHTKHLSIPEAVQFIEKYGPERGFIGHLSHGKTHIELLDYMPGGIEPAYDQLTIEF